MKNFQLFVTSLVLLTSIVSHGQAPEITHTARTWRNTRYDTADRMRGNDTKDAPIAELGEHVGASFQPAFTDADITAQKALIEGAFTHVPASANIGFARLIDGAPLIVDSRITGIEFHISGKVSSVPGNLSAQPNPVLKVENGVEYWQISGELSGLFTDEFGTQWLIGPIDPAGKNHRFEQFGPGAHPRAGLPGAFFALQVPVKKWNGGLIQIQPPGDMGFSWPAGPLLWNTIDPIVLLDRGYAVFTFGAGGTVPLGTLNGANVVDTNPESGTGIFWALPAGSPNDTSHLVSYMRPTLIDQNGKETALPNPCVVTIWDPFNGIIMLNFGDPGFFFGPLFVYPEPVSDTVVFAKNLLRLFTGRRSDWAAYVGWSNSGPNGLMIDSSTRGGAFQTPRSQGVQKGGGDFNAWGEPASGLRFDAFLLYANMNHGFFGEFGNFDTEVNPQYPIAAPLVWVQGDSDLVVSQSGPYAYANRVARALESLGRASDINQLMRIYALPKLTHFIRDQLFANFDRQPSDDALWYDFTDKFPNPGAFNTDAHGLRVSAPYARALPFNGPLDSWDGFFHVEARMARITPLMLQILANLHEQSQHGTFMPVSRVHPNFFDNINSLSTQIIPPYPAAPCEPPAIFDDPGFTANGVACSKLIAEDSAYPSITATEPNESGEFIELDELKSFATGNPLVRSTKPIILPDIAAPLGTKLIYFDGVIENPFTNQQLEQRYGSHERYVAIFKDASDLLVRERLWDPRLGKLYVREATQSSVLNDK